MQVEILVVDDEADIRKTIADTLEDEGYRCRAAADTVAALELIEERRPHLVILDIWLRENDRDGLELLKILKVQYPEIPVVMISGHGTIETAVKAIKLGAYEFVEKPVQSDRLLLTARRAVDAARLERENAELRERAGADWPMIGVSQPMSQLQSAIDRVGPTGSRVLIAGPSGSGKEVAARTLHARSRRRDGPFVVLNCATMAPDRIEGELFGSELSERCRAPHLRHFRARAWRNPAARRGRRHAVGDSGQDRPRASGAVLHPHRRRFQASPSTSGSSPPRAGNLNDRDGGRPVSTGSLLPAQRGAGRGSIR